MPNIAQDILIHKNYPLFMWHSNVTGILQLIQQHYVYALTSLQLRQLTNYSLLQFLVLQKNSSPSCTLDWKSSNPMGGFSLISYVVRPWKLLHLSCLRFLHLSVGQLLSNIPLDAKLDGSIIDTCKMLSSTAKQNVKQCTGFYNCVLSKCKEIFHTCELIQVS